MAEGYLLHRLHYCLKSRIVAKRASFGLAERVNAQLFGRVRDVRVESGASAVVLYEPDGSPLVWSASSVFQ